MTSIEIQNIFEKFDYQNNYLNHVEITSGHINDTYLVKTDGWPHYVLQRINHHVFRDVPGLIHNKIRVSEHLHGKMADLNPLLRVRRVLTFVPTREQEFWYKDGQGNFWNMMIFIDHTKTFETVPSADIAHEAGKLTGEFLNLTSDLNTEGICEVIPRFHDMSYRFEQFDDALQNANENRLERSVCYRKIIADLRDEMHILQGLKESGEIPTRMTHNDTKISNILFDNKDQAICMIDTDTVMPGIIHYDFGDAIRTICNTAAEDETDLSIVHFNKEFYQAYKRGFLKNMQGTLSEVEIKYLALAAKTMTFIMALRFLTDFLNNDIYYKIKYPDHNLDRAKNQLKLIQSMSEKIHIQV